MPKYNHLYSIAFSVDTDIDDPELVPIHRLIGALLSRIDEYHDAEAFSHEDTYEHEPGTPYCHSVGCMRAALPNETTCLRHRRTTNG